MRRLVLVMVLAGLSVLGGTGEARAERGIACTPGKLRDAEVTTSVRIKHDGEDHTRAEADLVVKVPKSAALAPDLLLNGDTDRYRAAMRCLLRDPAETHPYRDTELRPREPEVTVEERTVTVEYRAVTSVENSSHREFGPWRLEVGTRYWTLALERPPALERAWWREITVDLGGRAARDMAPPPTAGTPTDLTWKRAEAAGPMPELWVRIQPPATKALATRWNAQPWRLAGSAAWLAWDVVLFAVVLLLVRRLARAPGTSPATPAETATRRNLLRWAWLMLGIALVVELDDQLLSSWPDHRVTLHFVLTAGVGALLCLFARPRPGTALAVAAATAYPLVLALRPGWFGLPAGFWLDHDALAEVNRLTRTGGFVWIALAAACLAFVWLTGTVSAIRRMYEATRVRAPGTTPRGRLPWWVLPGCLLLAAALVAGDLWATHAVWEQETWLSDGDGYTDRWHLTYLYNGLAWFPSDWPDWFFPWITWWYGFNAVLLAALAARAAAPHAERTAPEGPDLALLTVAAMQAVVPAPGWYAGVSAHLLSAAITLLTGRLLLALGRRRAVLSQPLPTGAPLRDAIRERDRTWLIKSARAYRDLHSQLRRLEQGEQEGKRADLERDLDDLHQWNPPGATAPHAGARLPDSVDAVELALAWGPRATWWQNALRAARFSAVLALPATAVGFWANQVRGPLWGSVRRDEFGLAGLLDYVITSEIVLAGAGFVLGALWRVLPGRRGPAKALGLFLVYAAPLAGHWILTRATGQSFGTWALDLALTLLVLTSTGVAMDIDTFRQEGIYWPTKASLLLSVYQLRTASVQLAFFVAQVVALVGVWQQLKGNDPTVFIQPQEPPGRSGGPGEGGG